MAHVLYNSLSINVDNTISYFESGILKFNFAISFQKDILIHICKYGCQKLHYYSGTIICLQNDQKWKPSDRNDFTRLSIRRLGHQIRPFSPETRWNGER
ncbi:hypothetical protein L6164_024432 [Bauhinia variegata]|uniref:Uncharacterized protein n=1 Tax=Bauhinia variegata TaxID=167791 RepID=A0ACB9LX91_BAUVA|nr:hypothetical protein L6164_024432 [Bauhinia variegata]